MLSVRTQSVSVSVEAAAAAAADDVVVVGVVDPRTRHRMRRDSLAVMRPALSSLQTFVY